jgi:Flp pilus assembly protein TadG
VALSATVLFGIIALGLDAGRLYFERRSVQNAADAGALAGAQDLIPTGQNTGVTPTMASNARCHAAVYALKAFNDTPADLTCPATVSGTATPTQVTITTPSRGNANEIQVEVTFRAPLTFASIMGFSQSAVYGTATAHGGFANKTYTVFSYQAPGAGNTMFFDQNGNVQIDDGLSGQDMCSPNPAQGAMVSNAKFHAPNPNRGDINLNGVFTHAQASDTHAIFTYWNGTVSPTAVAEAVPNYQAFTNPPDADPVTSGTINGRVAHYYHRGTYRQNVNIPGSYSANDYFIFENGIYYFQGFSLNITGGTVANTSNGQPHYANVGPGSFMGGVTDLPAAPDGTNGVEFIFDGPGGFSATSPAATAPSVFLVAPVFVPTGMTDAIAFYIKNTDTNSTPWTETIDGHKPTDGGYPFQVWGTIFNADYPSTMEIQAASAWQSSANPGSYAVTGEFISPRIIIDGGGLTPDGGFTPSKPALCPNSAAAYLQNPAGLLVQYNIRYVPHFRGYAFLVK